MKALFFIALVIFITGSAIIKAGAQTPPNILLVLLDDLDVFMNSSHRAWMPNLWSNVADQGAVYRNMAVSMAWCCPSRVSLLTGRIVHNSNITSSSPPNGGASKFMTSGMDANSLSVWMQGLGYSTYFTGKYLNQLSRKILDGTRCPLGWDVFEASATRAVMSSKLLQITKSSPSLRVSWMPMESTTSGTSSRYSRITAMARGPPTERTTRRTLSETRPLDTLMMQLRKTSPFS